MQRTDSWVYLEKILPIGLILVGAAGIVLAIGADILIGGQPGVGSNQVSLGISGFTLLVTGAILLSSVGQRRIGEWLLVAAGVGAVVFAADLLVVGNLPSTAAKQIVVASVAFGLLVVAVAPAGRERLRTGLEALSVDRVKVAQFLTVLAELGLLVLVIRQFELENQAFYHNILLLTFYGFLIHHFLPARYRLPFFVLLSVAAIFGIFGGLAGVGLVTVGLILIGITHLPISIWGRALLLIGSGLVLALARMEILPSPIPGAIWPILGSIFMFRLIVYLYDQQHEKREDFRLSRTLGYFFLLPNLVFPLFPVVDYKTFRRTYYDQDPYQIYQTGLRWMLRGVIQLIVYRVVNYYLVISPQEVTDLGSLVRYLVPNILLLVRVTGQFHLAIGILHLFGFNLPRTNNRYFLASSFTDFWRRANIYWKDFMLKVFYYPAYFRLRQLSDTARLIIATLFVFVITWFFHAYQWFWLRGSFLFSAPDVLFWTTFGMLVLANSVYEARKGRKRTIGQGSWQFTEVALLSLKTLGTVATITVLWALWTSTSIPDFLSLWSVLGKPIGSVSELLPLVLVVGLVIAAKFWYTYRGEEPPTSKPMSTRTFFNDAALTGVVLLAVFTLGNPAVHSQIQGRSGEVLADLTEARLSDRDADLLLRGYYEDLVGINRFNTELWEVYNKRPADWPLIQETSAARVTDTFEGIELLPSASIDFHGARFRTNQWGMRDQEYTLTPPPETYRIALLGPSFVMGSGVANDETFDHLLEVRLNAESGGGAPRYEILNFGVAGYAAIQELYALEHKALAFEPDAVILVSHQLEISVLIRNLASRLVKGIEIPYDFMREFAEQAGVETGMTQIEAERLLEPYREEITLEIYRRMVGIADENGLLPIWVFIPTPEENMPEDDIVRLHEMAAEAGFRVISLADVYEGKDLDRLIVAEWDRHPNARAHRMIAEQMYAELKANADTIPLRESEAEAR